MATLTRDSGTATHGEGEPSATAGRRASADERLSKRERLLGSGVDPYPHVDCAGRTAIADLHAEHDPGELGSGEHERFCARIAGRVVARRSHSKTSFIDVRDSSGQIQITARRESLGDAAYQGLLDLDIGDIVSVEGYIYVTRRQALTLAARQYTLLSKALVAPPDHYHGLEDLGTRYRYREIDLLANRRTRELFRIRSETIAALRSWMAQRHFIEVETPILQTLAGGASARPFVTHHNALDSELSLRVSMELYLNRCLIGGLENVYDLGKCFRNEGISYRHSPEFTMLEWLQAYCDHNDVASFTEQMIAAVARRVLGSTELQRDGERFDLAAPWRRTTVRAEVQRVTGADILAEDARQLRAHLHEQIHPDASWAQVVQRIYSKLVEPTLLAPTLVFDFPLELFPITKAHAQDPRLAEHFDAVIGGIELVSADTELNDPVEQRRRFVQQRKQRRSDDDDAPHPHDEEYVRTLQYGLAPSASGGMGVDRLLMILTGARSLREVITFPVVRELR